MCDCLSDFVMGPDNRPLSPEELQRRSLEITEKLKPYVAAMENEVIPAIMEDHRRKIWPKQEEPAPASVGWFCPNCRNYHGPQVVTCPEPSRFIGLKDRIGQVSNG